MIHAYRKPLDPSTLVVEIESRIEAVALRSDLLSDEFAGVRDDLVHHLNRFLDGDEMPPPDKDRGPYYAHSPFGDGWCVGTGGRGGHVFRKESIAREAAATLNALVEIDNKV